MKRVAKVKVFDEVVCPKCGISLIFEGDDVLLRKNEFGNLCSKCCSIILKKQLKKFREKCKKGER